MPVHALPELEAQYRTMQDGVGLLDRGGRAVVAVTGPDAADYLQGQVTNDVLALEPHGGCYAALLNPKGRILADMRILANGPGALWLDAEPHTRATLVRQLEMYKIGRDVEVRDHSEERSVLSLIGPRAAFVFDHAGEIEPAGRVPLGEDEWWAATVGGEPVTVAGTNVGLDVICEARARDAVADTLVEAGAAGVEEAAAEIVRIETGRPRYGVDMTDENLPGEMGLEQRAVSFTKGCYVGQEPVARMYHRGHPNRLLRGLRLTDAAAPGETLLRDGKEVGKLTSAAVSPRLGPIALAVVRREVEPGEKVVVGDGGAAEVVALPFEGERV